MPRGHASAKPDDFQFSASPGQWNLGPTCAKFIPFQPSVSDVEADNVILLCAETVGRIHLPAADAVCCSSGSGGLLSTAATGLHVPAGAGRLRLSATASDVPSTASWPSVLLSAPDIQSSVTVSYPYSRTASTKARTFSHLT